MDAVRIAADCADVRPAGAPVKAAGPHPDPTLPPRRPRGARLRSHARRPRPPACTTRPGRGHARTGHRPASRPPGKPARPVFRSFGPIAVRRGVRKRGPAEDLARATTETHPATPSAAGGRPHGPGVGLRRCRGGTGRGGRLRLGPDGAGRRGGGVGGRQRPVAVPPAVRGGDADVSTAESAPHSGTDAASRPDPHAHAHAGASRAASASAVSVAPAHRAARAAGAEAHAHARAAEAGPAGPGDRRCPTRSGAARRTGAVPHAAPWSLGAAGGLPASPCGAAPPRTAPGAVPGHLRPAGRGARAGRRGRAAPALILRRNSCPNGWFSSLRWSPPVPWWWSSPWYGTARPPRTTTPVKPPMSSSR